MNQRLNDLDRELVALEQTRAERLRLLKDLEREVATLSAETDLLDKVEAVLQLVSSKVLGQSTSTIDQLVTAGLKIVFHDQSLTFKTTVDKFRGKTSVRFELFENGETAPLTEAYGGGVLVVVGVLLRVVTIMILNQRRFLLLDESLSHLSDSYVPYAAKLLKKLCQDLNFSILMISHNIDFANKADRHYEVVRSKAGTTFDLVPPL